MPTCLNVLEQDSKSQIIPHKQASLHKNVVWSLFYGALPLHLSSEFTFYLLLIFHPDIRPVFGSRAAALTLKEHAVWWEVIVLTLFGRSRLALALQIAVTTGRFPSLQAMWSGVLPWRSCWSRWQWCLRRQRTTSTWHLRTARWRAVWPSWRDKQCESSNVIYCVSVQVQTSSQLIAG